VKNIKRKDLLDMMLFRIMLKKLLDIKKKLKRK